MLKQSLIVIAFSISMLACGTSGTDGTDGTDGTEDDNDGGAGSNARAENRERNLFAGIPSPFSVVRYHSLIVKTLKLPLTPIAYTYDIVNNTKHKIITIPL